MMDLRSLAGAVRMDSDVVERRLRLLEGELGMSMPLAFRRAMLETSGRLGEVLWGEEDYLWNLPGQKLRLMAAIDEETHLFEREVDSLFIFRSDLGRGFFHFFGCVDDVDPEVIGFQVGSGVVASVATCFSEYVDGLAREAPPGFVACREGEEFEPDSLFDFLEGIFRRPSLFLRRATPQFLEVFLQGFFSISAKRRPGVWPEEDFSPSGFHRFLEMKFGAEFVIGWADIIGQRAQSDVEAWKQCVSLIREYRATQENSP